MKPNEKEWRGKEKMMSECVQCSSALEEILCDRYRYDGCGFPVILRGATVTVCTQCADRRLQVYNLDCLFYAVCMSILGQNKRLSGIFIKFLRRALRMSAEQFSRNLSVHRSTLSEWENNRKTLMPSNDKNLRRMVLMELLDRDVQIECFHEFNEVINNFSVECDAPETEISVTYFDGGDLATRKGVIPVAPGWRSPIQMAALQKLLDESTARIDDGC